MATPVQTRQPSPELFFETMNAYQRTEALKAAIQLNLFTAIGSGVTTAEALAQACDTSARGTRILCDYLVVAGFLIKQENRYALTPDSAAFLDQRSPSYLGGAIQFLNSPLFTESFRDLASVVRKGGTLMSRGGTLAPSHPIWVEFARAMAAPMTMVAELLATLLCGEGAGKWKVLDIAAGHGLFGIKLAQRNPKAEIVAVDWPNVLAVAQEHAQSAGVEARYRTIPGSAFEVDYGTGYDLILITNFLHHFDTDTCEGFLRKVYTALVPGGRAAAVEFIPNEDRISPPFAAAFSMVMLGTTPAGDAYTFSEYERMFHNAGFSSSELHPLPPSYHRVVISHK